MPPTQFMPAFSRMAARTAPAPLGGLGGAMRAPQGGQGGAMRAPLGGSGGGVAPPGGLGGIPPVWGSGGTAPSINPLFSCYFGEGGYYIQHQ